MKHTDLHFAPAITNLVFFLKHLPQWRTGHSCGEILEWRRVTATLEYTRMAASNRLHVFPGPSLPWIGIAPLLGGHRALYEIVHKLLIFVSSCMYINFPCKCLYTYTPVQLYSTETCTSLYCIDKIGGFGGFFFFPSNIYFPSRYY